MARATHETERTPRGMPLRTKFTLIMSLALTVVMIIAGVLLVQGVTRVATANTEERIVGAVELTAIEGMQTNYEQEGGSGIKISDTDVIRYPIVYGLDRGERNPAQVYVANDQEGRPKMRLLMAPDTGRSGRNLLGLILGITLAVIAAGAAVSVWVAGQVASPLELLVEDVRQISHGNLQHRTRVRGGGEVALLARALDRMSTSLLEAQDAELELSAREREMEVAAEVHEALLPESIPQLENYDIAALQIGCPTPGGDFYDFIELEDGRLGLLLCEVSGKGVPGALVAATARSYLRVVLSHTADMVEGFREVNRYLARDVRRGMFVTAMYVLLDPAENRAEVVCAGHKVPLLRFVSAERKMRTLQPEGIALGFDKGPVFDRALQTLVVELEPGDRLLLSNTGPVVVQNPDGEELGENAFYRAVLKRSMQDNDRLLDGLDQALDDYAEEEPFPNDITILTVQREG